MEGAEGSFGNIPQVENDAGLKMKLQLITEAQNAYEERRSIDLNAIPGITAEQAEAMLSELIAETQEEARNIRGEDERFASEDEINLLKEGNEYTAGLKQLRGQFNWPSEK